MRNKNKKLTNEQVTLDSKPIQDGLKKNKVLNFFVPIILFILIVSAIFARTSAIQKEHPVSFDESLYNYLGTQFKYQPLNYSSSGFWKNIENNFPPGEERARVQKYVDVPLFKHPPLFAYLIMLSKILFGDSWISSSYVSLFFGIGIILIVYFLSKELMDKKWALMAAIFMSIEPVYWLCSQKIWIETTQGFFLYLGILFLFIGKKNKIFFYLSAMSLGLSLLCKYSSVLAILPIYLILLFTEDIMDRETLKIYVFIPFVVGIPWVFWNYSAYGPAFLSEIIKINSSSESGTAGYNYILKFVTLGAIPLAILTFLFILKSLFRDTFDRFSRKMSIIFLNKTAMYFYLVASVIIIVTISLGFRASIVKGFHFGKLPELVPFMGIFDSQPFYFYFYHLMELSPIFFISYFSIIFIKKWDARIMILALIPPAVFVFLGFFKFYETRYVSIANPAAIILATYAIKELCRFFSRQDGLKKNIPIAIIVTIVMLAIIKTLYLDFAVVIHNESFFF